MVKQSVTTKKKSTATKSSATKKTPVAKKSTSKRLSEPFRPMAMTIGVSTLAAVTLVGFALISVL